MTSKYTIGPPRERRRHFIDTLCAMLGAGEPADPRQNARWRWLHATTVEWMSLPH